MTSRSGEQARLGSSTNSSGAASCTRRHPGCAARLATGRPIAGYIGFDPSADSLHIGHLVPIFGLLRLQRFGGRPVALVGGGTGMIGDPSGRSSERNLLDRETLEGNVAAIRGQLERFLDFSPGAEAARSWSTTSDWLGELGLIDFLRDTGKHFTIPYMLAKDSVQVRLDRGLSFTEFSYMLLQAHDFAHLHRTMGVEMQMGGADQWGNITAGLELIRRTSGAAARTPNRRTGWPTSSCCRRRATKFGKSEGGESVWLDPGPDLAVRLLPVLAEHGRPRRRHVPALVHRAAARGDRGARSRRCGRTGGAGRPTRAGARHHGPDARRRKRPSGRSPIPRRSSRPRPITDPDGAAVALRVGWRVHVRARDAGRRARPCSWPRPASSPRSGEARRMIAGGGVTINGERVADPAFVPEPIAGEWLDVRIGKRRREIGAPDDAA